MQKSATLGADVLMPAWKLTGKSTYRTYYVSDCGDVRSVDIGTGAERILSPSANSDGYLHVHFCGKTHGIHRLVAAAFLGPKPRGYEVNHKDGVKTHNRWTNLEYVTHAYNMHHASSNGLFPDRNGRNNSFYGRVHSKTSRLKMRESTIACNMTGERCPQAKLTWKDVNAIRARYAQGGGTLKQLAADYGVNSQETIRKIVKHMTWRTHAGQE